MQADVLDPHNARHVGNFAWLWREVFRAAERNGVKEVYFTPELGPPSSGYSVTYRNEAGERAEVGDRWAQTVNLAETARKVFAEVSVGASGL
jgi:hypothetical protein